MVEIWLPYGSSEIPVRVPEEKLIEILRPQTLKLNLNLEAELRRLVELEPSLQMLALKSRRICIALGGSSNKQFLIDLTRLLLDTLHGLGVQNSSLLVLLSVDAPALDTVSFPDLQIVRHSPTSSPVTALEEFKGSFMPKLNSDFWNADLKILLGEFRPHPFFGYSGICDILMPGLTHESLVQLQLTDRKNIGLPDIFKERLHIAEAVQNLIALGFVLDGDDAPAKLALGNLQQCVEALKKIVGEICSRRVERGADIVVMSAGGAPLDESLLRAVETFPAGLNVLKREGAMIVAAECSAGHGDEDFYDWCAEKKQPRHLETRLRHSLNYQGLKATFLLRALETHRIYLVSTIPDYYVENVFGLRAGRTVNSALQTAQRSLGSDSRIIVIPDASRVIPSLASL